MPTVLFTWELGAGFGHLLPYHALAKTFHDTGTTVVFAVGDVERAKNVFSGSNVIVAPAPVNKSFNNISSPESLSFAQILQHYGYLDVPRLSQTIAEWRTLYDRFKPDVVVVDHAPTSLLALRGLPTSRVLAGTGFACPPDIYPIPVLRKWMNPPFAEVCAIEDRVLTSINAALAESKTEPLQNLGQLFSEVDDTMLISFPELEHYPERRNGKYWGRLPLSIGETPQWPAGEGKKVFLYLKNVGPIEELLAYLKQKRCPSLVYVDGVPDSRLQPYNSDTLRVLDKMVNLDQVVKDADIGILNGGHGVVMHFLLAGKPLLLIPFMLENFLVCNQIHARKMGIIINPDSAEEFKVKLDALLSTDDYAAEARKFAAKYATFDAAAQGQAFVRRVEELARNKPDPQRFSLNKGAPRPLGITDINAAVELHQSGQVPRAVQIYQEILAQNPLDYNALHLLGFAMMQLRKPERAAALIGRAIALNPGEPAYHNNQGEAFRVMSQWDNAAASFRAALKLNPAYAEAANNLGLVFQMQGNFGEAVSAFQNALRINPNYALACNNFGVALLKKGDRAEALKAFERAIEIDPGCGDAHCNLGQLLLELHRLDEALPHCRKGVELRPGLPAAHNNLGNALRKAGQIAEAKAAYAAALKLDPNSSITRGNIAQILNDDGAQQNVGGA
jgi:tetratricopeptide (TPR) repeat protein